ncbi:MAG: very short patch repair endonuclease [Nanoarchaeota archaeon]|nr:very short patch repair endonuclease [Nanoarchaeota archaeon]MBU4123974.1 very short patch repair endonuclease [Nanoarchaeota archaeon]
MDNISKRKRSEIMSKIRPKNTKLEIKFKKILRNHKIKYRVNYNVFGKPDMIIPSKRTAIFIDSCFWHGCKTHCRMPSTNVKYWTPKIKRNKTRDKLVAKTLRKRGWKVVRIWEHQLKNPQKILAKLK